MIAEFQGEAKAKMQLREDQVLSNVGTKLKELTRKYDISLDTWTQVSGDWKNENNTRKYEVDFLIPDGSKISVIEVKSSQSKLHSSIDNFIRKYSARIQQSYIIYTKDMRKDGAIKCIPFYMTPFL